MKKPHKYILGTAAVVALFSILLGCSSSNSRDVEFVSSGNRIDVKIGGDVVTSYIFGDDRSKPSFVPVRSASGIELTRRYPLTELEGGSDDEPHHVGIYFAADQVNGAKFWNNTSVSPQIKHVSTDLLKGGKGSGTLKTTAEWINESGQVLLIEKKTVTFIAGENDSEYEIDFDVELIADEDVVHFEDIEEGVLAFRWSDYLREAEGENYPQPGKPLPEESLNGTGMYFSSNGDERAENIWGRRARWVALQGVRNQKVVGAAMLNHPNSINYPTFWHVRAYGLMAGNPLGQGDFLRQSPHQKNPVLWLRKTLHEDEKIHFRFKIIVFEGLKTQEQIESKFQEFVK